VRVWVGRVCVSSVLGGCFFALIVGWGCGGGGMVWGRGVGGGGGGNGFG